MDPFLECRPLKTTSEIFEFNKDPLDRSHLLRRKDSRHGIQKPPGRSKVLVCHDMRGNYLNDRCISGSSYENPFQIYSWNCIDIFCYFSHNLLSIPPLSWINCCRLHGVQTFGTLITEWAEGERICLEMFETRESSMLLATCMVEIAVLCGVDGWLINIENKLPISIVQNVLHFLKELTILMHDRIPCSQVIWYDAVTVAGNLSWQNELNDLNVDFFDTCDGIFINYTWVESAPSKTMQYLKQRSEINTQAKGSTSISNVYFGCDVFGRGTAFGGGFNCYQALAASMSQGASVAIFAPGWVLECCIQDDAAAHSFECIQDSLLSASLKLWIPIMDVLRQMCRNAFKKLRNRVKCRSLSFSNGAGRALFIAGKPYVHNYAVCNTTRFDFYDLSFQDMRWNIELLNENIAIYFSSDLAEGYIRSGLTSDISYFGTSSLLFYHVPSLVIEPIRSPNLLNIMSPSQYTPIFSALLTEPEIFIPNKSSGDLLITVIIAMHDNNDLAFRLGIRQGFSSPDIDGDTVPTLFDDIHWIYLHPQQISDCDLSMSCMQVLISEIEVLCDCEYLQACADCNLDSCSQCNKNKNTFPQFNFQKWVRRVYRIPVCELFTACYKRKVDIFNGLILEECHVTGLASKLSLSSRRETLANDSCFGAVISHISFSVSEINHTFDDRNPNISLDMISSGLGNIQANGAKMGFFHNLVTTNLRRSLQNRGFIFDLSWNIIGVSSDDIYNVIILQVLSDSAVNLVRSSLLAPSCLVEDTLSSAELQDRVEIQICSILSSDITITLLEQLPGICSPASTRFLGHSQNDTVRLSLNYNEADMDTEGIQSYLLVLRPILTNFQICKDIFIYLELRI